MFGVPDEISADHTDISVRFGSFRTKLNDEQVKELAGNLPKTPLEAQKIVLRLRKLRRPIEMSNINTGDKSLSKKASRDTRHKGNRTPIARKQELRRRERRHIMRVEIKEISIVQNEKKSAEFPTWKQVSDAAVKHKATLISYDLEGSTIKFDIGGKSSKVFQVSDSEAAMGKVHDIMNDLSITSSKIDMSDS